MLELAEGLNAEFSKFAPDYINDPKRAVYRIYRDVRFSPDKSPYKPIWRPFSRGEAEAKARPLDFTFLFQPKKSELRAASTSPLPSTSSPCVPGSPKIMAHSERSRAARKI